VSASTFLSPDVVVTLIALLYSAALQLYYWHVQKKGSIDVESALAIYTYIERIKERFMQCNLLNGFSSNYLEQRT
jgi:hypothetical protein